MMAWADCEGGCGCAAASLPVMPESEGFTLPPESFERQTARRALAAGFRLRSERAPPRHIGGRNARPTLNPEP